MEAIQHLHVVDSRETVEAESPYNTFEVLMAQVDRGELTFDQAVAAYKLAELGVAEVQVG